MAATVRLNSSPAGEARVDQLRRQLRVLERATGLADECGAPVALGIPAIDGALDGGLGGGTLHEIAATREAEVSAASGFALALAARAASVRGTAAPGAACDARHDDRTVSGRTLLWIAQDLAPAGNGG